jgi:hypothetical protein
MSLAQQLTFVQETRDMKWVSLEIHVVESITWDSPMSLESCTTATLCKESCLMRLKD